MSFAKSDIEVPKSLDAEASVLGSILLDAQSLYRVADFLRAEDFYSEKYQTMYRGILDLVEAGRNVDLVTLADQLKGKLSLQEISALTDTVPDFAHIEDYARIIKQKSTLRTLIEVSSATIGECYKTGRDVKEILDEAEGRIFEIAESGIRTAFIPIKEVITDNLKALEQAHERGGGYLQGVPTGFSKLDEFTTGFRGGELIFIAGRPGMGKTSFALSMALNMAKKGASVGFLSLEMPRDQLGLRLLCAESGVDLQKARSAYLGKQDFALLGEATEVLQKLPIYIDDSSDLDVLSLRTKCRRLKKDKGLDIAFIDYIQLMRSYARFENRNLELGSMSRGMKGLSKELSIPVVALSQLSRNPERRREKDARPQLSDLRESGNLEQDADLVLMIYREEMVKKDTDKKNQAEIIIAKQRNGPTGNFHVAFIKEAALFMDLASEGDYFAGDIR
jgi:replicative DNA helicase